MCSDVGQRGFEAAQESGVAVAKVAAFTETCPIRLVQRDATTCRNDNETFGGQTPVQVPPIFGIGEVVSEERPQRLL